MADRFVFSRSSSPFLICAAALMILAAAAAVEASGDHQKLLGFVPIRSEPSSSCKGSIAECLGSNEEFELDSEISRRILATTKYISYGALQRNTVPCSRRGASYYNCRPGAQANPYNRGCSAIARCRS